MRQDDTALASRPFKNCRIVGTRQADILNPHDVDFRFATKETADDIAVEVLVGG